MTESFLKFKKLSIALHSYLKGRGFNKALEAFDLAKKTHVGFRKDGITPNFQHQVEICLFIMNLKEIRPALEEDIYCAALLHDIREDHHLSHKEIEAQFGPNVADYVETLTKEFKNARKDEKVYFEGIADCPACSLIKGVDRINNISSMVGVFTIAKQEHYIFEIEEYFLPMLKTARNKFPDQSASYHLMSTFLRNMSHAIKSTLAAENELIELKGQALSKP